MDRIQWNRVSINKNKSDILIIKVLLLLSTIFFFTMIILINNQTEEKLNHSMEFCMQKTYEHVTGKQMPEEFFHYMEE